MLHPSLEPLWREACEDVQFMIASKRADGHDQFRLIREYLAQVGSARFNLTAVSISGYNAILRDTNIAHHLQIARLRGTL
jgi:hypothetical protein